MARQMIREASVTISGTYKAKIVGRALRDGERRRVARDGQKLLLTAEHLDPMIPWSEKETIYFDQEDLVQAIADNQAALDALVAGHSNTETDPEQIKLVEVRFLRQLGVALSEMACQAFLTRTAA